MPSSAAVLDLVNYAILAFASTPEIAPQLFDRQLA
jgi:hypothetical protein